MDYKISELNDADELTGAEIIEIVQAGVNRKLSLFGLKTYVQGGTVRFRGEWAGAATGTLPGDDLKDGDQWSLSEPGSLDIGDGTGSQPVNKYALLIYVKPGLFRLIG